MKKSKRRMDRTTMLIHRKQFTKEQLKKGLQDCQRLDIHQTRSCPNHTGQNAKCIKEEQEILKRWTEYCSELYNEDSKGNASLLNCPTSTNTDMHSILRDEVELAVRKLKKGKSDRR